LEYDQEELEATKIPLQLGRYVQKCCYGWRKDRNDLFEIEKLIKWCLSQQTERDLYIIWNSSINLKRVENDVQIRVPITFYHMMGLQQELGDITLIDSPCGYTLDGNFVNLPTTHPPLFELNSYN